MRRRVAIITNLFPYPQDATRGIFNRQQFEALSTRHDLMVLAPVPFMDWRRDFSSITQVHGMQVRYFMYLYPPRFGRSLHEWFLWRSLLRGPFEELRSFLPECILGCWLYPDGVTAARVARHLGVPLVLKAHGSDLNLRTDKDPIVPRIRGAVASASSLVVVSQALAKRATELCLTGATMRVIYNGVSAEVFSPRIKAKCRAELSLPLAGKIIVYVGNLKVNKGCVDLVNASPRVFDQYAECLLCFVGAGAAEAELRARAANLGISAKILFVGRQPQEEIVRWVGASDVVCLPSHAEGVPNVVLEALSCGRPVVATAVGGIPEIVSTETGRLVPPRSIDQLYKALSDVLAVEWPEERLRRSVSHLTWKGSGDALADAIDDAIASCPPRANSA